MVDPVEHHLEVRRTARYWTLGPGDAPELWFVLHGYRQLARRFLRRFEPVSGDERLIVAPEGLSRFYVSPERGRHGPASVVGASWMTREDREREIEDYVGYLDRLSRSVLGNRAPDPWITVLGFSQGAATAARWATEGRRPPHRLVLWSGYLPPDLDPDRAGRVLADCELVLVRGSDDPARDPDRAAAEAAALERAGLDAHEVRYEGGHDIDAETLVSLT